MKKYLIHLESKSDITLFPDSQKIFGWLISKISKDNEESDVTKLVNDIFEKNVKCMISNVLPKEYIPLSKEWLIKILSEKIEDEARKKKIYEKIKKIDFIKKIDLKNLINVSVNLVKDDKDLVKFDKYLTKNQSYIQKFRLDEQYYNLPGLLNKAYTVPVIEIINQNTKEPVKEFMIMIKTDSPVIIKWLEKNKDICIEEFLGSKGTQGYNIFMRKGITFEEEDEYKSKNDLYLNMGMLLPEYIIYNKSYIDLYTSDRKSFEITEKIKKVIGFINSGSLICSEKEVFEIGKNIKNKYSIVHKNAIIFGNSYLESFDIENFGGENGE